MKGLRWLLADLKDFLVHHKAWWITPIVVSLLALLLFAWFADDPATAPAIYSP